MFRLGDVLLATLLTAALVVSGSARTTAAATEPPSGPDGQIDVTAGNNGGIFSAPAVDAGARAPGGGADAPAAGPGGSPQAGGAPKCDYIIGDDEWAARYAAMHTMPPPAPNEHIYEKVCGGLMTGWVVLGPGGAPQITAAQLAEQAAAQLVLSLPVPHHSPDLRLADGRPAVVVGEPTWVWTEPASFKPLSKRVDAGPVWVLVTARPVGLVFDPGDGSQSVSCTGPGTPYDRSRHGVHEASPTCGFVYSQSSLGRPGDRVSATYAIRWQVSWVGATTAGPANGVLPELASQAANSFVVAEAQALRTQ